MNPGSHKLIWCVEFKKRPPLSKTQIYEAIMKIFRLSFLAIILCTASATYAASGAWTGAADGNWNVDGNWTGASYPGTTGSEAVTFNTAGSHSTISLNGAEISVNAISFLTGAGSYIFNADGGSLYAQSLTIDANVTEKVTQTFNLPVHSAGNTGYTNNSSTAVLDLAGGVVNPSEETDLRLSVNGTGLVKINGATASKLKGIGISKSNEGKLIFSGSTSGVVNFTLSGGILQFDSVDAARNVKFGFSGGIIGLGAQAFTLSIAYSGGVPGEIRWSKVTGDTGFAAYGADRAVNLGGFSEQFTWGAFNSIKDGQGLILGSADSTHRIDFKNPLGLGKETRTIVVNDGINPDNVDGEFSGGINGSGGLTKTGPGTLELSNENSYLGLTTVSAGRLLVSGTVVGEVTVAPGAILGGSGTIAGKTVINGSLRSGPGSDKLSIQADLTWNEGDPWRFELGPAAPSMAAPGKSDSQDQLNLTEGASFLKGSGKQWVFDFAGTGGPGWYPLVHWTGKTTFVASDFVATNLPAGLSGAFTVDEATSTLYLKIGP